MEAMKSKEELKAYNKNLEGCRNMDSPRMASFITASLGLRMTLLESLLRVDASRPGGVARIPGTGFNLQFKAGEYHTWSKTQIKLIMTSTDFKAGKIVPNPEDPHPDDPNGIGFWEDQGVLKFKKVEVIDKSGQGFISFEDIDLDKVTAPVKLKEGEKAKPRTPRMFVG